MGIIKHLKATEMSFLYSFKEKLIIRKILILFEEGNSVYLKALELACDNFSYYALSPML
jgi:hypothetical protein